MDMGIKNLPAFYPKRRFCGRSFDNSVKTRRMHLIRRKIMTAIEIPHPKVVTQAEWLAERKALLVKEKELTRLQDSLNAERRRLSMVKVEKEYFFDTADGKRSLTELFEGRRQLIVYHFMFGPDWEEGCPGCTGYIDAIGDLSALAERDTSFVIVSRAPLAKLDDYKAKRGWSWKWVSSFGSDFNYDFHVTLDKAIAPIEYNYRDEAELIAMGRESQTKLSELPGTSVFFRLEDDVYHTYSTFARGGEYLTHSSALLDITPYGRQEEWEESRNGRRKKPTYG